MNTRTKGRRFERDVADALEAAGLQVRGLEAAGDHLVVLAGGTAWHVEAKRQERMQLPIWLRQQDRDCPPDAGRVLVFKQSRQPAYAVEPFEQFTASLATLSRLAELRAELERHYVDTLSESGEPWDAGYSAALIWLRVRVAELLGTP